MTFFEWLKMVMELLDGEPFDFAAAEFAYDDGRSPLRFVLDMQLLSGEAF